MLGAVNYNEVTWTALFIPSIPLTASTTYTARLAPGIKDKVGNPMASEYSWQFTTESPANIVVTLPDNAQDLNFGNVVINTTPSDKIVNVTSTGTLDLVLGNINKTGPHSEEFSIIEDKCSGKTLKQFENCMVKVGFQPSSIGVRSAMLSVPSNDSDSSTLEVALKGNAMERFLAGDCSGNGLTSIDEVQKCINQYLQVVFVQSCNDLDGNGQVMVEEVQSVINAYLGL
ncbi:MAG: choice-of-anchor D domain-containing protein [Candidatus Zixiibacteriota bacterium]